MMPSSGTFLYRLVLRGDEAPWRLVASLEHPVEITGDDFEDARLVGHSPAVDILRDRITLVARQPKLAGLAAAFLAIDPDITARLRAGDVLRIARSHVGGLGASIIRNGQTVLAVGAVSKVLLGGDVQADCVWEGGLIAPWEYGANADDSLIAFSACSERHLLGPGSAVRVGPYTVRVEHGFLPGIPGIDECVSISIEDTFPMHSAVRWAELLEDPSSLTAVQWDTSLDEQLDVPAKEEE
jgi:hypothetical protein